MRAHARHVCERCGRNKDDDGSVGVQVRAESKGGDLGHGGGLGDEPAICLGPRGGDPASLFSLTGYSGVTGRARPPSLGEQRGTCEPCEHSRGENGD